MDGAFDHAASLENSGNEVVTLTFAAETSTLAVVFINSVGCGWLHWGYQGFKIAHQNTRSIIGKIEELPLIISEVKSSFHLLIFSERGPTKKFLIRSLKYPVINSFVVTEAAREVVSWFTQEMM